MIFNFGFNVTNLGAFVLFHRFDNVVNGQQSDFLIHVIHIHQIKIRTQLDHFFGVDVVIASQQLFFTFGVIHQMQVPLDGIQFQSVKPMNAFFHKGCKKIWNPVGWWRADIFYILVHHLCVLKHGGSCQSPMETGIQGRQWFVFSIGLEKRVDFIHNNAGPFYAFQGHAPFVFKPGMVFIHGNAPCQGVHNGMGFVIHKGKFD